MVKQKYSVFGGVLPISFIKNDNAYDVTIADKVMVICCALVKICESIVPKDYIKSLLMHSSDVTRENDF